AEARQEAGWARTQPDERGQTWRRPWPLHPELRTFRCESALPDPLDAQISAKTIDGSLPGRRSGPVLDEFCGRPQCQKRGRMDDLMVAVSCLPSRPPPTRRRTQARRRAAVEIGERGVEAADAAEARAEGDLGHRIVGSVEQPLGTLDAAGGRDLLRTCPDMA